jgi:phosphoenolpyruvate---glycerone phosphotransferase subunit DhaL
MNSAISNRGSTLTTSLGRQTVVSWLAECATTISDQRDYLVELDAAIGDGDHGTNLNRGFEAVRQLISNDSDSPPGHLLIAVGRTLVSTVGGASGPLWGSAFRQMGKRLGDSPVFDGPALAAGLEAGLTAIIELGAAELGDKTMVDSLQPAVIALRDGLAEGEDLATALNSAAQAAEQGMRATVALKARRGRASYLGERSIGHQDPGATSTAIIIRALDRAVAASS